MTTRSGTDEVAAQVAALEGLVPKLVELELMLADTTVEILRALEHFANHPELPRLAELLEDTNTQAREFNPLELLDLWWQEDIHSRILTWLLDPDNCHNLGDHFLKEFLIASGWSGVEASDDWSSTKSYREWYNVVDEVTGRLDILVVNSTKKFVSAIENKVYAPEGGKQLIRYRKALETEYYNFDRHYVFLSPRGIESQWAEEREYWQPLSYSTILQLVERTIDDNTARLTEEVRLFLQQYASTLRRRIVPETDEIGRLARRIYLENRSVIELINRHKPDYLAEIKQTLRDVIRQQDGWSLEDPGPKYVRFCSTDWERFECFRSGTGWPSKALILFEFKCGPKQARLQLVIGPGEESIRSILFGRAKRDSRVFNFASGMLKDGYQLIHMLENIMEESDLNNWDSAGSGRAKLRQYVADFAQTRVWRVGGVWWGWLVR
ncbi:MAG: PD-(D/E)XK nuclease family protein, partial [bacterium]|nr:PD-(D/E)XK nuclease family protein [bacterium]